MNYFSHESSYIDNGAVIGSGTHIWYFSHIRSNVIIGQNCHIGQNVYIDDYVHIGNNCKIQNNVSVYDGVTLEDNVFIGPSVVFTNDINPRAFIKKGHDKYKPTLVKEGSTIGANATIVCGHTIGKYSLIAAGSVITKDVPDYALMAGVPAIQTGIVNEAGEIIERW